MTVLLYVVSIIVLGSLFGYCSLKIMDMIYDMKDKENKDDNR